MNKFIKHEFDKQFIEDLRKEYKYFIRANDNFLSNWDMLKVKSTYKLYYVKINKKYIIF